MASIPHDDVSVKHITILDDIARAPVAETTEDPQHQRAVSWMSVYLSDYRDTPRRWAMMLETSFYWGDK